jgi:polyribonucleotide nucleotidyltransferase
MSSLVELSIDGVEEKYEFGKYAPTSNGSVVLKVGKMVLLATIVAEEEESLEEDFMPFTVQYIEKAYAGAKIPGGFIKRESKPGDFETLTSRLIDRSIRPLFPDNYRYPTTLTVMLLSSDPSLDVQKYALKAASTALFVSDIPVDKMISATRVTKSENVLSVVDSTEDSSLDLFLSGTTSELLMIEMRSIATQELVEVDVESFTSIHHTNELSEQELIEYIGFGLESISISAKSYEESFSFIKKEKNRFVVSKSNSNKGVESEILQKYSDDIKRVIELLAKSERDLELKNLANRIFLDSYQDSFSFDEIYKSVCNIKKSLVREMILKTKKRADGRALDELRNISIETNILPSAHSSVLFTRGDTQALVVGTLGNEKDAQMYDLINSGTTNNERFMLHYNFPNFCVGEARPITGVSRREVGHGTLAKKALESSIDSEFSDTVRLVSEILSSNGSSSMATVCAGSLALRACGVATSSLISGVAMGLVKDENEYAILTDILGLEDHDGDMDFKVTGSKDGITALQMDIKLGGISLSLLEEALTQSTKARLEIINKLEEAESTMTISEALPMINKFFIDPKSVISVIGKAGETIRKIISDFHVAIDLDKKSGKVKVSGDCRDSVNSASEQIKNISTTAVNEAKNSVSFDELYKSEDIVEGKVERIVDFGAFISLPKGGEGLLHISKISEEKVTNVNDVLSVGQMINIKVLSVKGDRIELGHA